MHYYINGAGINMKKKAVFLSQKESVEQIKRVYSPESIDIIGRYADLYGTIIDGDSLDENKEYLREAEVVFSTWGMPSLDEQVIEKYFPKLQAVFYAAGSVQHFARPFLNKGIKVISSWAANAVPVAEYTLAQIILANKGFFQNSLKTRVNREEAAKYSSSFTGNYSAKVGILGAGMIGKKVIELLKNFNIRIFVYDPYLPDDTANELGVCKCSLSEIFSSCHTISCHIANLPETVGIIKYEHFNRMLPNATFINTGRGAQVVEKDLIEALKEIPSRTAVLDVTYPEPVEPDSEFLSMDNVILTSHIAGSMGKEVERMSMYVAEEFERFINGKKLKYNVTLKMLETMA